MDPNSRFFFVLPLMMTTFFVRLQAAPAPGTNLVSFTCERSVYETVCVNSFKADPASRTADIKGLASISIKHTVGSAKMMKDLISLLLQKAVDPTTRQFLTGCAENYADAIIQLQKSDAALNSGKFAEAPVGLLAAMSDAEACKEGYTAAPLHQLELDDQNTKYTQLCSNALAIINVLIDN